MGKQWETYLSDSFSICTVVYQMYIRCISDVFFSSAFSIFLVFKLVEVTNFGSDLASGRILLKLITAVVRA